MSFESPVWPGGVDLALDAWAGALGGRRRGNHVAAPCPVHKGSGLKLYLYVRGDRLVAHCYSGLCHSSLGYGAFASELERMTGLRLSPGVVGGGGVAPGPAAGPAVAVSARRGERDKDAVMEARRMWGDSVPVPMDPGHPARRWLDARRLWRSRFPAPEALRWLPLSPLSGAGGAAGVLLALVAGPGEWVKAWPGVPVPEGVQRIPLSAVGEPAGGKISRGAMSGNVFLLGDPGSGSVISVTEGVADALALASRDGGPVVCTMGIGGMSAADRSGLAGWLAGFSGVRIWADRDEGKRGFAPAGLSAAFNLRDHVRGAGAAGVVDVCHALRPHKDPAAAAAEAGFIELDEGFAGYAGTLAEMHPEWPRWYVALVADVETSGGLADG